jgi:phage/plasmid-associated DNA primase
LDNESEKARKRIQELKEDGGDEMKDEKRKALQRTQLRKDVNGLQSASKIKSVLEVAQGVFNDTNAINTFDTIAHWFCFSDNKAYDLTTKQPVDIKATDRVLTTCGYPMPERRQEDIDKVTELLKTLVPEDRMKSLLSALSLFFYGKNTQEKFIIFKGEGRNGKGLLINLLKMVLGPYYYALPTEVLTEHSKGAGRACPELAQTKFSRCVMASEPDAKKEIVKTTLNLLTGNDAMTVRQLHKEPFTFIPSFTMGMMCNDIPNISGGINDAIRNRMEFQDFPFTFTETPTQPHHRKIDTGLKERIARDESYRNGLLYLVMDAWFENKGKYVSCEASKEEQETYAKANNPVMPFLERYEPSSTPVCINELQKTYDKDYPKLTPQKFRTFLEQAGVKVELDGKKSRKVYVQEKPQVSNQM